MHEDKRDWLIGLMEGVEDIPGTALTEGIDWQWESFPEYLDALEQKQWTVDVGTQIAHGAVRAYVMGDRGARNEPATPDDIDGMRVIVRDAIDGRRARLLDVAHHRPPRHRRRAGARHLRGRGRAVRHRLRAGRAGAGVFELAPTGAAGEDIDEPAKEVDWMRRLSAKIGRPVTFALIQVDADPTLWRELMDTSLAAVEDGADLWPQVAGRATGLLSGLETTYSLFDVVPAFQALKARGLSHAELLAALRTDEVRRSILDWEPDDETAERLDKAYASTYLLGDPPDYEPGPDEVARGTGRGRRAQAVGDGLRRAARERRQGAALRPDPQLLRRQPRPGPRDAPAPAVGVRAGRRRRALRRDLRRVDPDVHAHPLDP